jgi:lysophospholipase L1-like esterase
VVSRKLIIKFTAVAVGCLLGAIIAELTLRRFLPERHSYYIFKPGLSVTFHASPELMPGVSPIAHVQINSQGIIGEEWSSNRKTEYRIISVGGSTTACIYLDRTKSWSSLLQAGLGQTVDGRKVWVGNAGKAGFETRDHLAFMERVIGQYDVDAIVMLVGANDVMHRLGQNEAYDPHFVDKKSRYEKWLRTRFAVVPTDFNPNRLFFKRTALWQFGSELKRLYVAEKSGTIQDYSGDWLIKDRRTRREAVLTDILPPLDSGLDEYERNLTKIIQVARRRSIRIVLATQPTIWKADMPEQEKNMLWMGKKSENLFYTPGSLAQAMDAYNRRLIETCTKLNVDYIDIANLLPRSLDIFYDDMHFTEEGAKRVADELIPYFKTRKPFL